jgi:uncharacterized DUF497 family protein
MRRTVPPKSPTPRRRRRGHAQSASTVFYSSKTFELLAVPTIPHFHAAHQLSARHPATAVQTVLRFSNHCRILPTFAKSPTNPNQLKAICCSQNKNRVRLISARRATRKEQQLYHGYMDGDI